MVHGYVSYVTKYEVLLLELFHSNWCQKIVLKTKTTEELFFLASYSRKRKEVFSSHFLGFQQLSRCDKFLFFTAANFSGIFCLLNSLVSGQKMATTDIVVMGQTMFEFDYQKMNTFKFIRCSKQLRLSLFDE